MTDDWINTSIELLGNLTICSNPYSREFKTALLNPGRCVSSLRKCCAILFKLRCAALWLFAQVKDNILTSSHCDVLSINRRVHYNEVQRIMLIV